MVTSRNEALRVLLDLCERGQSVRLYLNHREDGALEVMVSLKQDDDKVGHCTEIVERGAVDVRGGDPVEHAVKEAVKAVEAYLFKSSEND